GQAVPLIGASFFSAFGMFVRGQDLKPRLNDLLALFGPGLKVRAFRYAGNANAFALAPDWSPTRLDQARGFCRLLATYGFYASFTAGDAQQVLADPRQQQQEV